MTEIKWNVFTSDDDEPDIQILVPIAVTPQITIYRDQLARLEFEARRMQETALRLTITNALEQKAVADLQNRATKFKKALQDKRKEVQREPHEIIRTLGDLVEPLYALLDEAVLLTSRKIKEYTAKLALLEAEKNALIQKKREELQASLDKEADEKGLARVKVHRDRRGGGSLARSGPQVLQGARRRAIHILRHDVRTDAWELVLYRSERL